MAKPVSADISSVRIRVAALVGVVVVVCGLLVGAGTAAAHAELLSSSPGNQEILEVSPNEIELQFTESVDLLEPGIRLIDAGGTVVELGAVDQPAGSDGMRAEVPTTLADGSYVVAWQAVSADSHRIRGSFTFSVGSPSAVPPGVLDGVFDGGSDSGSDDFLIGIGRFVSYAGIGLLVGGLVMAAALTPAAIGTRRVGVLLVVASELALVGTLWMIAAQAKLIGGSLLSWGSVADTQSGQWWIARLVVIAVFSVLIPLRRRLAVRGGAVVPAVLGLGVLGVVAAGGHGISGDSIVLGFASTVAHLGAMAIWFGGLAIVLFSPVKGEFWSTVTRFSPWALGSVAALALTGAANAWRQLGSLAGVTDSSYGRWLVVKLVLVVLVVGLAAYSRRTVRTRGDEASSLVRRSIGVEFAGVVLILGATAGLVNSPPPLESAEIVSASAVVGARVAQVELEPAVIGGTEMHVYITSPSGALDSADEITVTAELPEQDIPPLDIETFPAGVNHVVGTDVNLPVAGLWTFEVTARYGDFDQVVFTLQIPVAD